MRRRSVAPISSTRDADKQYTREIQTLEAEIKRIESDLVIARRAETVLETQKQENLQLKETIDRMRFDLDEARAAAATASKGSHGRSGTSMSSAGGTLSRNLGDEINRRLLNAQVVSEEQEESEGDSIVETIVTTQRRRVGSPLRVIRLMEQKVNGRKVSNSAVTGEPSADASASAPIIEFDDEVHEYADAATLTDPVEIRPLHESVETAEGSTSVAVTPSHDHPPAYTAQPDPIDEREVLERAHPRQRGHGGDVEGDYAALVGALGMRCTEIEEKLQSDKAERAKNGTGKSDSSDVSYTADCISFNEQIDLLLKIFKRGGSHQSHYQCDLERLVPSSRIVCSGRICV